MFRLFFSVVFLFFVGGCSTSSDPSDLKAFIDETLSKPRGRIDPIPVFKPYESFTYSAAGLRSPFELPVLIDESLEVDKAASDLKPNLDRPKEHLEQFSLGELAMVGTLQESGSDLWVLIRDGDGGVVRVREGAYIGQNHGKIISVADHRLNVIEIVPNGMGGWIERPRTIVLEGLSGD